jgi:peptide/nickel transport system substrate-binding protein
MRMDTLGFISRRRLGKLLGASGAALAAGLPGKVFAQASKTALVIGIDISDTISLARRDTPRP